MDIATYKISTPLGDALFSLDDNDAIRELKLGGSGAGARDSKDNPVAVHIQSQLDEYFAGQRREFELLLAPQGTGFQVQVWKELTKIPYGTTVTYGDLANRLDNPKGIRAVGRANGANPIWIIIPCHRVLGADGSLTGYAGGLEVKRKLLDLEGALQEGLFGE